MTLQQIADRLAKEFPGEFSQFGATATNYTESRLRQNVEATLWVGSKYVDCASLEEGIAAMKAMRASTNASRMEIEV